MDLQELKSRVDGKYIMYRAEDYFNCYKIEIVKENKASFRAKLIDNRTQKEVVCNIPFADIKYDVLDIKVKGVTRKYSSWRYTTNYSYTSTTVQTFHRAEDAEEVMKFHNKELSLRYTIRYIEKLRKNIANDEADIEALQEEIAEKNKDLDHVRKRKDNSMKLLDSTIAKKERLESELTDNET